MILLNATGLTFFTFSGGMLGLGLNIIINLICGLIGPKDTGVGALFDEVANCDETALETVA